MSVINKRYIEFKTKNSFLKRLNAGDIKPNTIVFIKDTREIYTRGTFYSQQQETTDHIQLFDDMFFENLCSQGLNKYTTVYSNGNQLNISKSPTITRGDINYPDATIYIGTNVEEIVKNFENSDGSFSSPFEQRRNITNIKFPNGVKSICDNAFYGCLNMKTILLPSTLSKIEPYTFCNCYSLINVELPDGITYIGDSAFRGCTSLTSVRFPQYVNYIGDLVFRNSALTTLFLDCTTVPTLATNNSIPTTAEIYVNDSIRWNYYSASNWYEYANRGQIKAMSEYVAPTETSTASVEE